MATLFPTSLDVLHNPHSAAPLHSPSHADQHINANDAIEALEARVGITASTDPLSHEYRLNFFELDGLHNVSALSPSTGDTIRYNSTTQLWEKYTLNNFITTDNLGNTLEDYVPIGDVGQPDGVASLDSTGNIPVTQLGNLIDGAPGALNTLNELAAALADDANYATTITNALALKAPLASPTFTGSVDFSSATVNGVISTVQQNGTALSKRPTLNFLGGALIQDDLANNRINVTITGGIPELIDGGNFDSVSPYDGGAPDATTFENTFDAGEIAA